MSISPRHTVSIPPGLDPVAVLEATAESILITNTDLDSPGPIIVYVNPSFERMTGWTREEILGQSPRVLQGPDTDRSIFNDMRAVLASGKTWEGQTFNYRKNGTRFVMEWSITPLCDDRGDTEYYVSVQRDVTARVEAERKIAQAQAVAQEADRKKANLSRYFSPKTVDLLTNKDEPLRQVQRQEVAILFADIAGFTAIAESLTPEQVIKLLQSYYRRMESVIFKHDGAVEKYVGDALMATFGVPTAVRLDAANALSCAFEMVRELWRWNRKREVEGRAEIRVGIGLHYGPAVFGDIGSERTLAFTVVGDTVNIASRLQAMSRSIGAELVVSEEVLEQIGQQDVAIGSHRAELVDAGDQVLRGRARPVRVWTWSHDLHRGDSSSA